MGSRIELRGGTALVTVSAVCPGVINTPILQSTRFIGDMANPRTKDLTQRLYNRAHRPEVVADAVLSAIQRDRAVVPAGAEARIGWHLAKVTPVAVAELIGRPAPKWLTRGRAR